MAPDGYWAVLGLAILGTAWAVAADEGELLVGEKCFRNGRCRLQFTECVDNFCRCREHFVSNKKKERCLQVSQLNDHCEEDVQCQAQHSFCKKTKRICDCRRGYVQSQNKGFCLPVGNLGDFCEENIQCQDLTECRQRDKRCICHGIAYEHHGRCVTDHTGSLQTEAYPEQAGKESSMHGSAPHQLGSSLLSGFLVFLCIAKGW